MKIQVTEGTFDKTCTTESDLLSNSVTFPEISDVMQYVEQRNLITYLVSGAKYGPDTAPREDKIKTKIGAIPKDKLIGSNGYKYRLMGRIQKPSKINQQVGVATEGGFFQLSMEDNLLYPGLMVTFRNQSQEARVYSMASGTTGNYVYTFQTTTREKFDYNTWVAPMAEKKLFGGYTTYGEKSTRGYSRSFYPDTFIGHTTIQRKSTGQTGGVTPTVLWVKPEGKKMKGWYYEVVSQMNKQASLEDEYAKMFGRTNMRTASGELKQQSDEIDGESGYPIVRGSGIWEQIEGVNDSWTTGVNGRATYADFRDHMNVLRDHCQGLQGNMWIALTGKSGMTNAYDVLEEKSRTYNLTHNQNSSEATGGPDVSVGYNFNRLAVDGNSVVFCEHPIMTDRERWQEEAIDGSKIMSGSYIFLNFSEFNNKGQKNIEILGRGAYGVNRAFVSATIAGMTGYYQSLGMKPLSPVDADEYHTLKEDGIFIYNTKACGILHRSAA